MLSYTYALIQIKCHAERLLFSISTLENMAFVYILSNKINTVLYIGVTNNLVRRVWEHKEKLVDGFTKKYAVEKLVYYEQFDDIINAIEREKELKTWHRPWKERLIKKQNPEWKDLYKDIC